MLTVSEAARYLGVSVSTLRRWADAGHVGYCRTPGDQRRFWPEQLDSLLASMEVPTTNLLSLPKG
jgi:excisionase family DNA binding protein